MHESREPRAAGCTTLRTRLSQCSLVGLLQSEATSAQGVGLDAPPSHNTPVLWRLGRLCSFRVVRVVPTRHRVASASGLLEQIGSTTPRRQNQLLDWVGGLPEQLSGHVVFFGGIVWIGAGDPVLGSLPRDGERGQRGTYGFVADEMRSNTLGKADFGGECERPNTGWFAKGARTLVEQGTELVATLSIENGCIGKRARRFEFDSAQTVSVEGVDGVANGLVAYVKVYGNRSSMLACSAGKKHMAAAHSKADWRMQSSFECCLFVRCQRTNKKWCLHTSYDSTLR